MILELTEWVTRIVLIAFIIAFVVGVVALLKTRDRGEGRYDRDRCPFDDRGHRD